MARELVEEFGLAEHQAAHLLGLVPSAVSQYVTGKRLGAALDRYARDEATRRLTREGAQRLTQAPRAGGQPRVILETAIALADRFRGSAQPLASGAGPTRTLGRTRAQGIRRRIAGEQAAVAECMRLAQKSRDELTRALFRQIAADSLRHAEIAASLASYLDRGISQTVPSGISRADVDRLIAREHAAEESSTTDWGQDLGGIMRLLWESMESDERKHERLLAGLRKADFPVRDVVHSHRKRPRRVLAATPRSR